MLGRSERLGLGLLLLGLLLLLLSEELDEEIEKSDNIDYPL